MKKKVELEFDGEELIRRMECYAKHATGEKPLTLRTTRLALPPAEKPLKPREIVSIRERLGVSQAVFAALLNVPKPTAISWENGVQFSRQGLDRLMADVRRGQGYVLVCYKLDRLGRSLPYLAQLVAELAAHNVALICTSQGIDTSNDNPAGRLQLGVLIAVAEFERAIIRERVAAGLRAARANGVKLGRPATLSRHQTAVA